MSFHTLGLAAELIRAVAEQGYSEPTPVQRQAIPVILSGKDIMGGSQTGTGKTAAFTLPMLQRLISQPKARGQRTVGALILVPTRELAAQVGESVRKYSKFLPNIRSSVIYGGVSYHSQIKSLRGGVDVLIATPGRLLDHVDQRTIDLSKVEMLVLDEADRMLDMGFINDIRRIITLLPKNRQNLMFSATFSNEIKRLADGILTSPEMIEVARSNIAAEGVTQVIHPVDGNKKQELLTHLISSEGMQQVLVFTRTKRGANRVSDQLREDGISATSFHGDKTQAARSKALADFKRGVVRVLVATDIAARGLDINDLPCVVNYELPNVPEDYVHRIGRTGRAGNEGAAVSLVCVDEHSFLRDIERLLKKDIPRVVIDGYEPDPKIRPKPIFFGRKQGGSRHGGGGGGDRNGGGGDRRNSNRSGPGRGPRRSHQYN